MKHTLEYILLTQSPALFLFAVALLLYFLFQRKAHRFISALALIVSILCLGGGIALYYLGMLHEHFTIHDFWQIQISGWIGLGIACAIMVVLLYRSAARAIRARRAEKLAVKAEKQRIRELEDAKNAAYASGRADALAEEKVIETVSEPAEGPLTPEQPSAETEESTAI